MHVVAPIMDRHTRLYLSVDQFPRATLKLALDLLCSTRDAAFLLRRGLPTRVSPSSPRLHTIVKRLMTMAVPELAGIFQNTTLNEGALPFSPRQHTRWSDLELQPVPRFLFRVYTPKSDGITNEHQASSRDAAAGKQTSNKDVFSTSKLETTATQIADHLWWRRWPRDDNLVSWSSSMLFLIPYIFYRHRDSCDGSPLDNIRLLVVDTEEFPAQTFIRDSDLIAAFKKSDSREDKSLRSVADQRSDTNCYFGEYLSQGSLRISGKCSTVSAQIMIDKGLLDLHSVFGEVYKGMYGNKWVVPVLAARQTIESAPRSSPATLQQLNAAFNVALTFGEGWSLPIAVQLLAILPYGLDPSQVYEELRRQLGPDCQQYFKFGLNSLKLTSQIAHEINLCTAYWQAVHAPLPMPELIRGKACMRKLFMMHVESRFPPERAPVAI